MTAVGSPRHPARVAVIHLGRGATGEERRVAHWRRLMTAAGGSVVDIPLLREHRRHSPLPRWRDLSPFLRGAVVPETQAWNPSAVNAQLEQIGADVVIAVTLRAFHPDIARSRTVVLDYVDALSRSYADRATGSASGIRRTGFGLLARTHHRAEATGSPVARRVAAGWSDARDLGCEWVPITVEDVHELAPPGDADIDVGFVGNLRYQPNVEAIRELDAMWPALEAERPGIRGLIAGADPTSDVLAIARRHRWTVEANFARAADIYARLRLAISPLLHASGIQIKVLDAAAYGVPQVVSPAAIGGFAPGIPVRIARDRQDFISAVLALLDDDAGARELAASARKHVQERYSVTAWLPWADRLVTTAGRTLRE